MSFQPQRARITRESEQDQNHASLHDVTGFLAMEPEVGDVLQLFLDNGELMRTSTVKHVEHHGSEIVVDTENSRYRLTLRAA